MAKTHKGEVMAKELKRRTSKTIELRSLDPDHKERTLSSDDVQRIARIMWSVWGTEAEPAMLALPFAASLEDASA